MADIEVPEGWRLVIKEAWTEVIEHPAEFTLYRDDGRRWPLICSRGKLREIVRAVIEGNPLRREVGDAERG